MSEDRDQGVDFTDINPDLEKIQYPITMEDFVAEYGEHTIERTNADPIRVRGLFEGTGMETFESAEGIRQSLLNLMPKESVGRQHYSDRGGSTPDDDQDDGENVSI